MSETIRSFTRPGTYRVRRRRLGCLPLPFVAVALVLLVWAGWVTRDSQSMHELVPARQDYRVFINDFLNKRSTIAESQVWALMPEDSFAAEIPGQLSDSFGMPEWILNNLIYGTCLITGNDLQQFSDVLLVTRMTRVGCLVEKFHGSLADVEEDDAGGLELRRVVGAEVYYAVRGRILLASRSRHALINALTLSPADALDEVTLEQQLAGMGGEDLSAHLHLSPEDPMGPYFQEVALAVRLAPTEAQLRCRALLQPEWTARLGVLVGNIGPQTLRPAPEGMVRVSANLGRPLPAVWTAINESLPAPWSLHEQLFGWINARQGAGAGVHALLSGLLSQTGPGWGLSWYGIDQYAMVPMPEVLGVLEVDPAIMEQLFHNWPELPAGASPWESVPRYDEDRQVVYLPMPGGPALEPTAAIYGNSLLVSSSRTTAEKILSRPVSTGAMQRKGNLYVEAYPHQVMQALTEAGMEFARFGALRGYTEDTFQRATADWLASSEKLEKVTAMASHESGAVEVDLVVSMKASEAVQGEPVPLAK